MIAILTYIVPTLHYHLLKRCLRDDVHHFLLLAICWAPALRGKGGRPEKRPWHPEVGLKRLKWFYQTKIWIFCKEMDFWLVVYLPLWKIWKSIGMILPNIWKSKKCSKPPIRCWSIFTLTCLNFWGLGQNVIWDYLRYFVLFTYSQRLHGWHEHI